MAMSYYTLVSKLVDCPMWEDKIKITAKYSFVDDDNPYQARFMFATCEVIENAKLPERKKDKRLGLYRFCKMSDKCPHLHNFNEWIDVRKP